MYISGEKIIWLISGVSKFCSIIFSRPLPIETHKNNWGNMPIKVAKKKLWILTLKIHGNTFEIAKGIPPMSL